MKPWKRELWAVQAKSAKGDPFLLSATWDNFVEARRFYLGEPPRALLFTNREEARRWIRFQSVFTKEEYKHWKLKPVRVVETVRIK